MIEALSKVIKRLHYPIELMLVCVHWYSAYPLSLRHIEEMMAERGVFVDHATVHRWSIKMLRSWPRCFAGASALWASAGEWTKPTSKSAASGSICTEPSTVPVPRSTLCFVPTETTLRREPSSNAPSMHTASPRRSPSTRALPTRQPSRAFAPTPVRTSGCASRSTSTTSSSRITGRSNASCDPCSAKLNGSKDRAPSAADKFYSPAF